MLHGADSCIVQIKSEGVFEDLAEDVEIRFDTSNYEVHKALIIGKNKKEAGLMEGELGGKMMKELVALWPKMYISVIDDGCIDKNAKGTRKCVIEQEIKF